MQKNVKIGSMVFKDFFNVSLKDFYFNSLVGKTAVKVQSAQTPTIMYFFP